MKKWFTPAFSEILNISDTIFDGQPMSEIIISNLSKFDLLSIQDYDRLIIAPHTELQVYCFGYTEHPAVYRVVGILSKYPECE